MSNLFYCSSTEISWFQLMAKHFPAHSTTCFPLIFSFRPKIVYNVILMKTIFSLFLFLVTSLIFLQRYHILSRLIIFLFLFCSHFSFDISRFTKAIFESYTFYLQNLKTLMSQYVSKDIG